MHKIKVKLIKYSTISRKVKKAGMLMQRDLLALTSRIMEDSLVFRNRIRLQLNSQSSSLVLKV